jgi:hypothetical protein
MKGRSVSLDDQDEIITALQMEVQRLERLYNIKVFWNVDEILSK